MSLTSILKKESGRTNLKKWFTNTFPNPGLKEKIEIKVNPKQPHHSYAGEIGTAFDYLFRFNLERINKKTVQSRGSLVAESGLDNIFICQLQNTQNITIGYYKDRVVNRIEFETYLLTEFENAKKNYKKFIKDGKLTNDIIKSSILLAKLDVSARTRFIDSNLDKIEKEKIIELEELFNIVPWDKFITKNSCILNPTFGDGSRLVGGADADLILDNTLIDIKTNKNLKIERKDLNQIIGYHLLSVIGGIDGKIKTEIQNIGIYFARFGYLWQMPLTDYCELKHFTQLANEFTQLVKDRNLELIKNERPQRTKLIYPVNEYTIDENDFKCPFCESTSFIKHGKNLTTFRYKCKSCNSSFTSTIDTSASSEEWKKNRHLLDEF